MSSARYFVAVLLMMSLPPGIMLWFFIHPIASFWRRLGPVWTYAILSVPVVLYMLGVFFGRDRLVGVDYGTSLVTIALAALCAFGGAWIAITRRKLLTTGVLAGLPELSEKRYPGKLLREGIYGRVRHPRYIEVVSFSLAYALFANYLGAYVMVLLLIPTLYLVVVIEERELHERFGEEYEEYCRRVPRFFPRGRER
jgi:protein-S-isoprenylcysteine O-methyltransferase Ste14